METHIFVIIVIACVRRNNGTPTIACDVIDNDAIRVTWHFDPEFKYYVVSWYAIEDYEMVNPTASTSFRAYVNYDYESEIYRYSYDRTYEEVMEDIAASINLLSFDYDIITSANHHEILAPTNRNATFDISVRGFINETRKNPHQNLRVSCDVKFIYKPDDVTSPFPPTTLPSLAAWSWFVIIPGSLLGVVVLSLIGLLIYRFIIRHQMLKKSPVGLLAHSSKWSSQSRDEHADGSYPYRHWVPNSKECWSPPLLGYDDYISTGSEMIDSMHYRRHSLTTVTEESTHNVSVERDDVIVPRSKRITSSRQNKTRPSTRGRQTPRSASSRLRFINSRSSKRSDFPPTTTASSMSLWWSEDETLNEEMKEEKTPWPNFGRQRKYRPEMQLESKGNIPQETDLEEASKQRSGTPAVMSLARKSYSTAGGTPTRKLRATKSTLNVLPF